MSKKGKSIILHLEGKTFYVGHDGTGLYFSDENSPFCVMIKNKKDFSIARIKLESNKIEKVRKAALEYLKYLNETVSVWDLPYKHYDSDVGSILIGNDSFKALFHNGYGDIFRKRIILIDDGQPFTVSKVRESLRLAGTFFGKGYVYDYDIPEDAKPLYEVDGEYCVFQILHNKDVENPNLIQMPTGNMLIVKNA